MSRFRTYLAATLVVLACVATPAVAVQYLKQSTAVDVPIGPFVDDLDAKTAETGLTLSQADIRLKKGAGNWAQKNQSSSATHEENGNYETSLDATDTNTLGPLRLHVAEAGALPVWRDFVVLPANTYDSLIGGTDALNADVDEVNGVAVNTSSAQLGVNVVNAGGTAWGSGAITAGSIAPDALGASELAADAATEIATATWASGTRTITGGTISTNSDKTGYSLTQSFPSNFASLAISAGGLASANAIQISGDQTAADNLESAADGTGYNLGGGLVVAAEVNGDVVGSVQGNIGGEVFGPVGSVLGDVNGGVLGSVAAVGPNGIDADSLAPSATTEIQTGLATSTVLSAVKAKTDNLPADPADDSGIDGQLASIASSIAGLEAGAVVVPVNQITVPDSRTFVLEQGATGLAGNAKRYLTVGDAQVFAFDFFKDLPTNGRLQSVSSVAIVTGTNGGVTFASTDNDPGVDKTQGKVTITGVTAGTYLIRMTVTYQSAFGLGTRTGYGYLVVLP